MAVRGSFRVYSSLLAILKKENFSPFLNFSRPAPKCVKIRRGEVIEDDQPNNYEDDSDDDSDEVKYLPDNVTKYR